MPQDVILGYAHASEKDYSRYKGQPTHDHVPMGNFQPSLRVYTLAPLTQDYVHERLLAAVLSELNVREGSSRGDTNALTG